MLYLATRGKHYYHLLEFTESCILSSSSPPQSHLLGDLTEVPIPVRFIYFLLGPQDSELDYHEVGRSMATLMSDKVSSHGNTHV